MLGNDPGRWGEGDRGNLGTQAGEESWLLGSGTREDPGGGGYPGEVE